MSSLENCLISTYVLWFSTWIQMEKNWGDTPSATLKNALILIHVYIDYPYICGMCVMSVKNDWEKNKPIQTFPYPPIDYPGVPPVCPVGRNADQYGG